MINGNIKSSNLWRFRRIGRSVRRDEETGNFKTLKNNYLELIFTEHALYQTEIGGVPYKLNIWEIPTELSRENQELFEEYRKGADIEISLTKGKYQINKVSSQEFKEPVYDTLKEALDAGVRRYHELKPQSMGEVRITFRIE